jgi:tRNA 2-selenouridine synthase
MANFIQQYQQIFAQQLPLIDLRAPIEFSKGAFNQSVNLPLMTDKERELVGTCYKQKGQQSAIVLGHQLVSGQTKQQRLDNWQNFIQHSPTAVMYCFRGGLRSQTVQQWLAELEIKIPIVQGGYKSMRQYLLKTLEQIAIHPIVLLAGNTGSGKTAMLAHCANSLNLEQAAQHRGSSFGAFTSAQATQINFENRLAEQYLTNRYFQQSQIEQSKKDLPSIVLEDEGHLIGRVSIPLPLLNAMKKAAIVVVEHSFEYRLEHIFQEYIVQLKQRYLAQFNESQAHEAFSEHLRMGLYRIRKRLGSARYLELNNALMFALNSSSDEHLALHLNWLKPLLNDYYDPMYQYQLSQKADRIVFKGTEQECLAYLNTLA